MKPRDPDGLSELGPDMRTGFIKSVRVASRFDLAYQRVNPRLISYMQDEARRHAYKVLSLILADGRSYIVEVDEREGDDLQAPSPPPVCKPSDWADLQQEITVCRVDILCLLQYPAQARVGEFIVYEGIKHDGDNKTPQVIQRTIPYTREVDPSEIRDGYGPSSLALYDGAFALISFGWKGHECQCWQRVR